MTIVERSGIEREGAHPMATTATDPKEASIFVVEDNPDNLMIVLDYLTAPADEGGCEVAFAEGAPTSILLFSYLLKHPAQKIDVILLDLQLPHQDGYQVLEQIRRRGQLAQTRVIALTANVLPSDVDRARKAGFDGFIGKPLNARRFPDQIRRVLAGESVWEPR